MCVVCVCLCVNECRLVIITIIRGGGLVYVITVSRTKQIFFSCACAIVRRFLELWFAAAVMLSASCISLLSSSDYSRRTFVPFRLGKLVAWCSRTARQVQPVAKKIACRGAPASRNDVIVGIQPHKYHPHTNTHTPTMSTQ